MEQTIIIGNLGRDPELRYTPEGKAVCNFSVAVSAGKDKEPHWYRVSAWEKEAENANKYLKKGSKVAVIGRSYASAYQNKESGEIMAVQELSAARIEYLSSSTATQEEVSF